VILLAALGCSDELPLLADAGSAPAAVVPKIDAGTAADAPASAAVADGAGDDATALRKRDTLTAGPDTATAPPPDLGTTTPDAPAVTTVDAPADAPAPDAAPDLARDTAPDLAPEVMGVCAGLTNGAPCPDGHCCAGACVSNRSVNSCGSSCNPCPARANTFVGCDGQSCTHGCYAGYGDCDGNAANGCETSTTQSAQHCGGCAMACQPAHAVNGRCAGGSCTYDTCALGWRDCDGQPRNGCEAQVSDAGGCP
jgi:hypothetical protein